MCFMQETSECELKLINAENLFKQGLFYDAENLVRSSIDSCSLKKTNKIEAIELLARIYSETDNLIDANKNIRKILKLNPNYQPDQTRIEEDYLKYFSKFKVMPSLIVGAYSEFVFPKFYTVGNNNSVLNDFDYSGKYTSNKLSNIFGINIIGCLPTNTRFSIHPGYFTLNYKRKITHKTLTDYYTTLTEKDNYLHIPLEVNQHFKYNKFTYFVGIGFNYSLLNKASAEIAANYPNLRQDTTNEVNLVVGQGNYYNESSNLNLKEYRGNVSSLKGNIGITYTFKNFIIDFKYSYCQALSLSNSENYYLPDKIIMRTNYIDNSFFYKYSSFNLSINYVIFHKIKKINK